MDDLISRQAAIDICLQYCPDDDGTCSKNGDDLRNMLDEIEALPTADAVRVVRCGECIHYLDGGCGNISQKSPAKNLLDVNPNWYCADGERDDEE